MGEILYGLGVPHAPQFVTRPATEDADQLAAIDEAYAELHDEIHRAAPDAIILISNDHLENYFLDNVPPFLAVVGESAEGSFGGRSVTVKVAANLARKFLYHSLDRGFDLSFSYRFELGHSFLVPLIYLVPKGDIPVLVLSINTYLPPQPTAKRAFAFGEMLGDFLRNQPGRYVVVASGGLSHFPGTPEYSHPRNQFDEQFLELVKEGRLERLAGYSREELDSVGNLELLSWTVMAGALGPLVGEVVTYQPSWHHGYAVSRFRPRPVSKPHYAMADPARYHLNAVLRDLMLDPKAQDTFLSDRHAYLDGRGLATDEAQAVASFDSESLEKMGANPFLSFMAELNLKFHTRRQLGGSDQ